MFIDDTDYSILVGKNLLTNRKKTMLLKNGYNTWAGLVIAFLGMVGLGDIFPKEQIADLVNIIFQFAGIIYAMAGNFRAHREINRLRK